MEVENTRELIMANSTEETKKIIITREDKEAAKILVALSRNKRYLPREEDDDDVQQLIKVDNSNETLMIVKAWNRGEPNPRENISNDVADLVESFSEPIKKQLTMSDVKEDQCRLMLGKDQVRKKMRPLLTDSEIKRLREGLDVTVYGPNQVVQRMKFKTWCKSTPVLTTGWRKIVNTCDLKAHCDFLHIWMFRHRVTGALCFVIEKVRHSTITKPLGKEILDQIN